MNTEEDGPIEVCVPTFPEILGAYEAVYRWVKEHGREPDGPLREIYLNEVDEELHMEIAVPLR